MSGWHLMWIVPVSMAVGVFLLAILKGGTDNNDE